MASTRAARRDPLGVRLRLLGCAPADPGGGGCGSPRQQPWSAAARCRWQVHAMAALPLLDATPCGGWPCLAAIRRLLLCTGRCFPTSTVTTRGFPLGADGPLRQSASPSPVCSASAVFGVLVLGRGKIPARRWPALTTATPEGAVTSMEALSWPGLTLSSSTGGNPWSSSLDKAAVAPQRHSLLEGVAWVALGVPNAAAGDGGLPVFR